MMIVENNLDLFPIHLSPRFYLFNIDRQIMFIYFLENDIERLKRRVETLVKSNDEKVWIINFYNWIHMYYSLINIGKKN